MPFDWRTDGRTLFLLTAAFIAALAIPFGSPRFEGALHEAFALLQWYAREHVVLCLLPALLLAGPALSLPNMLVIQGFLGTQKTLVYVSLVVVMATITGMVYGTFWA